MSLKVGFRRSKDSDEWEYVSSVNHICCAPETIVISDNDDEQPKPDLTTVTLTPDSSPIKKEDLKQDLNEALVYTDKIQNLIINAETKSDSPLRKKSLLQCIQNDQPEASSKQLSLLNGVLSLADDNSTVDTANNTDCNKTFPRRSKRTTNKSKENGNITDLFQNNKDDIKADMAVNDKHDVKPEVNGDSKKVSCYTQICNSNGRKGIKVDSPPKKQGRPRKTAKKRTVAPTNDSSKENVKSKDKQTITEENKPKATIPTLVTDYFSVRRSTRMTSTDIKKMQRSELENKILNDCEEGLKVQEFPVKGRGVVSTCPFARGDFVVEYKGDLIHTKAAKDREEGYSSDSKIGCYMYYFTYNNESYCLDATKPTQYLGRLLNHSRRGNCKTRVVGIDGRPYLILVAARDIETGEELLYDYGDRSPESLKAYPWLAL